MPSDPLPPLPLPTPPRITLDVARDRTSESRATGGFLNLRRVDLVARYPDGTSSAPFPYDIVDRAAIDAVVIVAWERVNGEREVYIRSAVRAPIALREGCGPDLANLWELPAGIVDPGESPADAAARELGEELGYEASGAQLTEFAPWTWPAPGFVAERHHFFCLEVTGATRGAPTLDGSALEQAAAIVRRPLHDLLALCRAGQVRDAKTELALRRFAEQP